MDLSIISVNWNSTDYLLECLTSIYQHTEGIVFEVVVIDNGSENGDLESTIGNLRNVKLIRSSGNVGFAKANNLGFQQSTGRYVLFLNPDTKLIGPSINVLLNQIMLLPDAGIVGCKLLNSDLSVQLSSIDSFPTILNQVLDAEYLRLRWPGCPLWTVAPLFSDSPEVTKVDVISGACMLLRRDVFQKVGMFSEEFFMYAEDLDLNYKVQGAGFKNYYVGETAIIHHGGKSSSRQRVSQWATIMKFSAMLRLFRKTRGPAYGAAYRAAMGAVALARLLILALVAPFGNLMGDRTSRRYAAEKWKAVLTWALGRHQQLLLQSR